MLREAPSTDRSALSGRAGVAMLTLQLRSALQEAANAEAEEAAADRDAARDKLRAQLAPLVADRRGAFEAELALVRVEASASVAAARRAAAAMVTQTYSLIEQARWEPDLFTAPVEEEVVAPVVPIIAPLAPAPSLALPTPSLVVEALPPVDEMLHWFDDASPGRLTTTAPTVATTVGIDAEAFAHAFATAFAALLDERGANWAVGMPAISAPAGPAGPKPSFWTHARHPDVLLIGLAMIIMLIVVAAWLA
jgi:hypothetical protein